MMKNSNAGISNAREYQSLWRHLAYRTNLCETFEDDAKPLDDESDLEFEVEPLPGVSPDVAANVAACVKVLAATGPTSNASSKSLDTSFVIDIPNSSSGWEVRGHGQSSNIIVQGTNTPESQPARKKRKLWTSEEDRELIAAVEKCGEGNWATMLKGAFKHDRTAAQLSQRWALIRKRRDAQTGNSQGSMIENHAMATGVMSSVSGQIPVEAASVLPAQADLQKDDDPGTSTAGVGSVLPLPTSAPRNVPAQDQHCNNGSTPSLVQSGKGRNPIKRYGVSGLQQLRAGNSSSGLVGSSPPGMSTGVAGDPQQAKSVVASLPSSTSLSSRYSTSSGMRNTPTSSGGHPVPKSPAGPDPMVQAAAVAAGARIAPASAAASLLKAAHSGNVVHIGPGGVAMGKAGTQSQTSPPAAGTTMKTGSGAGSRPPASTMVRYIRTGTGSSQSLHLAGQRTSQGRGQFVKSGSPQVVRPNALTISSGPSGLLQKGQPSTATSGSGIRGKINSSSLSPIEGRISINEVRPAKVSGVDEMSPLLEGSTKVADQEAANDSASDSIQLGETVEGKVGLPQGHEGVDPTPVNASSITIDCDKVDSSNNKDRREDQDAL